MIARPNFEFVNARFAPRRGKNGKTHTPRVSDGEPILILPSDHRRSPVCRGRRGCRCRPRNEDFESLLQVLDPPFDAGDRLCPFGRQWQRSFAVLDARENGRHRVVLGVGNGIELVRVAASTTQGEPHEGGTGGAQHVVDLIGPLLSRQSDVWALHDIHRTTD